ncbi:hypothetical protein BDDG_09843 [Blastomyces dermatitidis ATCC 18188]|uniref:Uncharacterized protein n=1 Tax=Ajellomyces dermatitidis (strain ATCC 18188 / CBS 674.68) TaxID=653446 RepID=F2TUH9_AJEDA|nr:hypothetical protein BDDG_09843 [Blastomyces dermatitidis ATCC 18188]
MSTRRLKSKTVQISISIISHQTQNKPAPVRIFYPVTISKFTSEGIKERNHKRGGERGTSGKKMKRKGGCCRCPGHGFIVCKFLVDFHSGLPLASCLSLIDFLLASYLLLFPNLKADCAPQLCFPSFRHLKCVPMLNGMAIISECNSR